MYESETAGPIFIHGVLPRSGTNFLCDLLLLHPHCAATVDPVREDLFLEHSDHLIAFSTAVRGAWDPAWGHFDADLPKRLHRALGDGLVSFLQSRPEHRLVSKSPSVRHIDRFFDFFPDARLLLLVRDGRSVTQSSMDTFGWSFERSARAWALAADTVSRFRAEQADRGDRWRLVRYEDLVHDLDNELPAVLETAALDAGIYDLEAARNLPVRGSSQLLGPGQASVNWDPVAKTSDFAPTERWHSWSPARLERFEWLAGPQLRAFGYEPGRPSPAAVSRTRQRLLDARWVGGRAAREVRAVLGRASRPLRRRLRAPR